MSYKYKNISDVTQDLQGVGPVEAGAEIVSEVEINNANFELVSGDTNTGHIPPEAPSASEQVVRDEDVNELGGIQ